MRLLPLALALLLAPSLAAPALAADTGDKVHGEQLFQEKGCAHCHGADRRGTDKGPSLANVRKKLSADKIRDQIVHGGAEMPAFGDVLSAPEIDDLIAWLRTKAPKPPKAPKHTPPPPAAPAS